MITWKCGINTTWRPLASYPRRVASRWRQPSQPPNRPRPSWRTCPLSIAAEEAKRIHGEPLPLDAVPAGEGYFGFWLRRPVGVIAAISPFNFPLNLVAHKVAPALAAGTTVVLKPASSPPITAVKLCEILSDAGLPGGALNLVVGPGGSVAGGWASSFFIQRG